jgi:hypothetical protein
MHQFFYFALFFLRSKPTQKHNAPNFPRSHFISLTFSATKHRKTKKKTKQNKTKQNETKGEQKNLPQILTPTALRIGGF